MLVYDLFMMLCFINGVVMNEKIIKVVFFVVGFGICFLFVIKVSLKEMLLIVDKLLI